MRKNLPITNREYPLQQDQSLISRTDAQGNITYVNREFVEVSGFTTEELLGSPHNIVRHPDMPREAFADMWATLKSGQAWTGMVKNRRKNGDHYWVQANATPITDGDRLIGYTSVRTKPSQEQIQEAEAAYARIRNGSARGLTVSRGAVVRTGLPGLAQRLLNLRLAGKIKLVLTILCIAMIANAALCLYGINRMNTGLHSVYQARTLPMGELNSIVRLLNRDEISLLEALASQDSEEAKSARKQYLENAAAITRAWNAYRGKTLDAREQALADQFYKDYLRYANDAWKPAVDAAVAGNFNEAEHTRKTAMKPAFASVRHGINDLLQFQLQMAEKEVASAASFSNTLGSVVIVALVCAIVAAVLVSLYLVKVIVAPMKRAVGIAKQIAACNLTGKIETTSRDETGELMHALNTMMLSLSNIVKGVRTNAEAVASGAAEIASGNMDLSSRTEQQAANLQETASSMEQLTATVQHNAHRSQEAKALVGDARDTAVNGGAAMDEVVKAMDNITSCSKRITEVIGLIDSIAFQTNILALNAAVEAARAGDQGRGFAVVATEVRTLAQRSATAAKEIKELIHDSAEQIRHGSDEVEEARQTVESVVASVNKVADLMNEINNASREQSESIGLVNTAVVRMDNATQQNAALVEQAAAASANLRAQGAGLLQETDVFRLA